MNLIIFDDGTIRKLETIGDSEISAAQDRVCELVNISDPSHPSYYNAETYEWEEIESA